MANKFIFRVEHEDGCGPYNSINRVGFYHGDDYHPTMRVDFGWDYNGDDFCGFQNKQKLHDWFTNEEILELKDKGFKIYKIRIPKHTIRIGKSKKQCIFKKTDIVKRVDVTHLF